MTLLELIKEKGLSRYSLSKISGVEWDTLSGLCSGETRFEQCSMETLSKLAEALGINTEELVLLETGNDMDEDGRPRDKKYLETGLPESLQHSLDEFIQGEKDHVPASGEAGSQKSMLITCGQNICLERKIRTRKSNPAQAVVQGSEAADVF